MSTDSSDSRPALEAALRTLFPDETGTGQKPLFLPVDDDDSSAHLLDLPVQGWPVSGLEKLGRFLGLPDWELPPDISRLDGELRLTRLEIDEPIGLTTIDVKWLEGRVPIIPGVLEVSKPGLRLCLDGFPATDSAYTTSLTGTASLGKTELAIAIDLPGMAVDANLVDPCPLGPLIEHFGLDSAEFGKARIRALLLSAIPQDKLISFTLELEDIWEPGGGFTLDLIEVSVTSILGEHRLTSGRLEGRGSVAKREIDLVGEHAGPGQGWILSAEAEKGIEIGKLLESLLEQVAGGNETDSEKVAIPGVLQSLKLENPGFAFETLTRNLSFNGEVKLDVTGTHLDLVAGASLTHQPEGGVSKRFTGQLTIADPHASKPALEFDVVFGRESGNSAMLALYRNVGGDEISLTSLVEAVSGSAADALGDVDLKFKLKDVVLIYEPARSEAPESEGRIDGEAGTGKKSRYLFALDLDTGLDLSGLGHLPLIGKFLPADQALRLAFQPVVVSADPPSDEIRDLLPEGSPHLPETFKKGFSLVTTLRMGESTRTIEFGAAAKGTQLDQEPGKSLASQSNPPDPDLGSPVPPNQKDPAPDPAAGLASNSKDITWIDLQKNLGPLHFQRVGIGYNQGSIDALLDASLSMGPVAISLNGLGASYNLQSKKLAFVLKGLGIDFRREPLEIGGSFLEMGHDYAGKITIRAETFALGGLGAYGEHDGHPSLFLYAFLDQPLGGPAFFFVEGLALGFGCNRRLTMPAIDAVHTFPLVADVMSGSAANPALGNGSVDEDAADGLTRELARLESFVSPQIGEHFLAVGVKFNSFKQVDSFALLALSFGKSFEFDLVGLSTMKIPSETPDSELVAQLELELLARFVPEEGFLGVQANLTPKSFILSRDCHLQGGFAFFNWFSGEHDGDFVISVGGYHPDFDIPAHYPRVAPAGFNWQVDSNTHIKGRGYLALTPSTVMAGGALEATWESSCIRAWFNAGADFLIEWKPFHYEAGVHIDLGAEVTIDLFFGSIHLSLDLGADLEIWGPEFSGNARIHVSIVSFSVGFGNAGRGKPLIPWSDKEGGGFKESFLPAAEKVCHIAATRGLIRTVKHNGEGDRWIVNGKEMCLAIDSVVPSSRPANLDNGTDDAPPLVIRPTGEELDSRYTVAITHREVPAGPDRRLSAEEIHRIFSLRPSYKKVPTALWMPSGGAGSRTTEALTGYTVHPAKPATPGASHWVPDKNLQFDVKRRRMTDDGRRLNLGTAHGGKLDVIPRAPETSLLESLGFEPAAEVRLSRTLYPSFTHCPAKMSLAPEG